MALADDGQLLVVHSSSLTTMQLSSATNVQDVLPNILNRGVNLDGSGRAGSGFGWRLNANSIGGGSVGGRTLNAVDLVTGSPTVTAIDLSLPAKQPWAVGRSYSTRQDVSGHLDSDGYQGRNWFQLSQPELVFYDNASDAEDMLYLVYGADRFIAFRRVALDAGGYSATAFRAVNGAAGVFELSRDTGTDPDLWTYHDQVGNTAVFFGFDDDAGGSSPDAGTCSGQLWKVADPADNTAYVGDSTTISTAISNGYDSLGRVLTAYDSVDRRYSYTYATIDSATRLTQVVCETKSGGTWASPTGLSEVGKVDYGYYDSSNNTSNAYGDSGCLKLVTITTPLSDSGVNFVKKIGYRYWTGSYNATTNPGHAYALQYIIDSEGYRQADWADGDLSDNDPLTMNETILKPYASAYFEYEDRTTGQGRVNKAWFNGECGCSGGINGTYLFTYDTQTSGTWTAGYDTAWKYRAVIAQPDGTYQTRYFDEVGQSLSKVTTDGDPAGSYTKLWATKVVRDSSGLVTKVHTPANENGYTHDSGGSPDGTITSSTNAGLVQVYGRVSSGDLVGLLRNRMWQEGTSGTEYFTSTTTLTTLSQAVGDATLNRPVVDESWSYDTETTAETAPSATQRQRYTYAVYLDTSSNNTVRIKTIQIDSPAAASSENGSGVQNSTSSFFNEDGRIAFTKSPTGIIGYREYNAQGRVTTAVKDADTSKNGVGELFENVTIPTGFSSWGAPEHIVSTFTFDDQGRAVGSIPSGFEATEVYYSTLADGTMVRINIPRKVSQIPIKYFGPASYTVTSHAGKSVFSGTIAIPSSGTTTALSGWIDETKSDPVEALGVGTLSRVSVTVFNKTGGSVTEARSYIAIPGSPDYLPGTEGTHYDATFIGYDDMGRRWRSKDATGTITRTVFDDLGRAVETWIGTNDSSFAGGETTGSDTMVKTSVREYDASSDGGNSLLTKTTSDPDGNWSTTSDQRVTEYKHDVRGRVVVTINAQAPHLLVKYDERGRVIASASYTLSTGLDITDDPETLATNRASLSKTLYDELGRSYESRQYKINQSTGAIEQTSSNDTYLRTQTWYDPEGRVMKSVGSTISKTRYDRLGRATHQWTLAKDNDTFYEDATSDTAVWDSTNKQTNIAGDKVATENQTVYEADTGNVIMRVAIERDFDDYGSGQTTGALDSNADNTPQKVTAADISGRVQITASWYDKLSRVTDTAQLGTNGGTDYDRSTHTSAPARSDTELVTTITYNDDGSRLQTQDPAGTKTQWEYDDAGRVIATISNYIDGTPSSATGADDNFVRQVYTNGLQTKLWVDLDGDNIEDADDQVTTYAYGITDADTPGPSQLNSGRLLRKVTYPDSASSSDVVRYAYDALGAQIWMQDQAGNIIETDYDTAGRQTHRRVSTLASGFDGSVRRISTAYTSRGQLDTVTQYDNATVGSGNIVDQVHYTYDQWNNTTTFDQDFNSAISSDSISVSWSYNLAQNDSAGIYRQLRKTGMTLPNGESLTYEYDSLNGLHDDRLNRVSRIKLGTTTVASYDYQGFATLIGTQYPEADLLYNRYNTSGTIDRLDQFNRVTADIWTRGIDTDSNGTYDVYRDFYDTDSTWSRSSNIDLVIDNVYPNRDMAYTNDGLERLAQATQGTWDAPTSSMTTTVQDELWTLSQTGNWQNHKLDLDGNGSYTGTDELDDNETFNTVNELTARDTDSNSTNDYTLAYDAAGNMTDDGKDYKYVYDAFGRLVQVKNQAGTLVAEYSYNGLGYRTGWHYDVDGDLSVEANTQSNTDDPWFQFVYDSRWRLVATYRASHYAGWSIDANPKEQFVYNMAGVAGSGGSSYIDSVIMRDRDANTAWASAADSTLEERVYYCQNWRSDVISLFTDAGQLINQVRYDPYGVPFGISKADLNADGAVDNADYTQFISYYNAGTMPWADWNFDGVKNTSDLVAYINDKAADVGLGRGVLSYSYSHVGGASRKGYAGYEIDPVLTGSKGWATIYHVRNRVYLSQLGRWTRRNPQGYVPGELVNLFNYVGNLVLTMSDPTGEPPWPLADGVSVGVQPQSMSSPPGIYDWRSCPGLGSCPNGITRKPGKPPKTNGCGPNFLAKFGLSIFFMIRVSDFAQCCNNHDLCYGACGADKNTCDKGFFSCLMATCNALYGGWFNKYSLNHERCIQSAELFYRGVKRYGKGSFCAAQKKNCKCKKAPKNSRNNRIPTGATLSR